MQLRRRRSREFESTSSKTTTDIMQTSSVTVSSLSRRNGDHEDETEQPLLHFHFDLEEDCDGRLGIVDSAMQQQLHSGLASLARHHQQQPHHHGNNNDYDCFEPTKVKLENSEEDSMAALVNSANNGSSNGATGDLELSTRMRSRLVAAAAAAATAVDAANEDSSSESSSPAINANASTSAVASSSSTTIRGAAAASAAAAAHDSPLMPADGFGAASSDAEQEKKFKSLIYRHPLFPLLGTMLEYCEMATQSSDGLNLSELDVEVRKFVDMMQRDQKPLTTDNQEVNELMIMAIRVLRIHLIELDKVGELCKDFCQRYIATIKPRMASENLLRSDYGGGYDSDDSGGRTSVGGANGPGVHSASAAAAASSHAAHQMAAAAAAISGGHGGPHHPSMSGHPVTSAGTGAPPPPHMMHAAAAAHHAALMGGQYYMHPNVSHVSVKHILYSLSAHM